MGEQLTALINIKPTRLLIEPGQKGRTIHERMLLIEKREAGSYPVIEVSAARWS